MTDAMTRAVLLLCGIAMGACTRTTPPVVPTAESGKAVTEPSQACVDIPSASPFKNEDATRIVVADFRTTHSGDGQFADSVTRQVAAELQRFKKEELPELPAEVKPGDVQVERVRCFIEGKEQAERVAEARKADVVLWGRADTAGSDPERAASYAVSPRATVHPQDRRLQRSVTADSTLGLSSLGDLTLPKVESTAPSPLAYFVLGVHFLERNLPSIAAGFFEKSVQGALTPNDDGLATLHAYLGIAYLESPGGAERTIAFSQTALKSVQQTGSADESVLLSNIGVALSSQGKAQEAEGTYRQALAIDEKAFGKDHPRVAISLNNIGSALRAQGKVREAEGYYRQGLAIDETAFGRHHPSVARDLNNIGVTLEARGKATEAEAHFRQALAIDEKAYGKGHRRLAISLGNIGSALQSQGKSQEAEGYFRQALAIDERILGRAHTSVARDLNNVGLALQSEGKAQEAEGYYRQALDIYESAYGRHHAANAAFLNNVGSALRAQNRAEDAEWYFRRALAIDEKALGKNHPDVARDLSNVGLVLLAQNKPREAEGLFRQVLDIDEKAFGKDHPHVARDLNNLAQALNGQGKTKEAERYHRQALSIKENVLGKDNPDTAISLNNLASVLCSQKKVKEAEGYYRRALDINEKALGDEHPNTLSVRNNFARCLASLSGWKPAKGKGAVVSGTLPGSEAETLGMELGDLVVQYAGRRVANAKELAIAVGERGALSAATMVLIRKGRRVPLEAEAGILGVRFAE